MGSTYRAATQKWEGLATDVFVVASVICWSPVYMLIFPAGDEISDNDLA